MTPDFTMRIDDDTEFAATVEFIKENDICGEGYEGHSFAIVFDNPKFHSPLCVFEDIRAEDIKHYARLMHREFMLLFKAVQS